ncbi:sugar kinase [Deinococcus aerolatus]|uniref:Sugar kinase n=1 Tax=Deinococcus aerolatus TaxID=522487 RepID=A0ABQ2G7L8_9DEIO|nr:gluconokinase [Deinococcus aerolatus]GGL78867.1 sugar kinase [Deinococcus aerolatus]
MSLTPPNPQPMRGPPPVMLSLDLGSSGMKGSAFDTLGRPLAGLEAHSPLELQYGPDGAAEVNLPALVRAIEDVLDRLHQRLGQRPVLGVALTSFVSSLVALDHAGQPTGPALSYADTRAAGEVEAVAHLVDPGQVGCPAFSAYWPAQIRWWRAAHPHLRAARYCSVPDYLTLRWTGAWLTSYSLASWTGMLDRASLTWNAGALAAAGVGADQLPELADHDAARTLRPAFQARWPKLAGAPFYVGVSDGATATVGSGAAGGSRVALTVGSTSAVRLAVTGAPPAVPSGLWSYRIDRQTHLLGGALTEGGNLYEWLGSTLQLDHPNLDRELLAMAPDSHGLTFLPSLGGTRSPDYDPHTRGTVHGLGYATTPVQIARAAMEGVACRLADLAGRLPLPDDAVFIASGRALLASRPWQHMLADALGRPLLLGGPGGASARGAAMLALSAQGYPLPTGPGACRRVDPVPGHHERYQAATRRMHALEAALRGLREPRPAPGAASPQPVLT